MDPQLLPDEARSLLDFWFGDATDDAEVSRNQARLWFEKNPSTDAMLEEKFGPICTRARAGELDSWKTTPRGRLALVIAIDQLSRNIYRNKPEAFQEDGRALELSLEGIELGQDRVLRPIERNFLYMPLMHAEDRAIQARSVELFQVLVDAVPEHQKGPFEESLRYAIAHRDIVERFGRFPHRNVILGRTSTAEEMDFLTQPGSSF